MTRIKITEEAIKEVYEARKSTKGNHLVQQDIAHRLASEKKMSHASALHYFYILRCMKNGDAYQRNMSAKSLLIFVEAIYEDFGLKACHLAIKASDGHLKYHADAGRKLTKFTNTLEALKHKYSYV